MTSTATVSAATATVHRAYITPGRDGVWVLTVVADGRTIVDMPLTNLDPGPDTVRRVLASLGYMVAAGADRPGVAVKAAWRVAPVQGRAVRYVVAVGSGEGREEYVVLCEGAADAVASMHALFGECDAVVCGVAA